MNSEQKGVKKEPTSDLDKKSSDWEEVAFSEVIKINDYPSAKKGEEYRSVGMSDLARNKRKIQDWEYKEYTYSRPRFKNGQTLMARITPCLENGKTAFVNILDNNEAAVGSTEFIVLSATDRTLPKFVYYTARRPEIRQFAIKRMTGTSGRQRVPLDIFDNKIINLPPLKEQKKIVNILDSIDAKIEVNNRINMLLEEISQTLFRSRFVNFEPYESFKQSELGQIPDRFEVMNLTDIADVTYGYSFASEKFNEEKNGMPIIRIRNISDDEVGKYSPESFDDKYLVQPGDVLAGMDGEFRSHIWKGPQAGLNQRVCKFEGKDSVYSEMYLWNAVRKPLYKLEKSKTGTTVIHLGKRDIDDIMLAVPDHDSLSQFNSDLEPVCRETINCQKENRELKQLRDTLLSKLMSGEIRVGDIKLDELEVDSKV